MELLLCVACIVVLVILSIHVNKKCSYVLNPTSIMVYLWCALLFLATLFADNLGFNKITVKCILYVFFFLLVIEVTSLFFINNKRKISRFTDPSDRLYKVSIFFFAIYVISTLWYFYDLSKSIPLTSLLSNFWRWKNLILTGQFNENSFFYIGRSLPLTGFLLSINFLANKEKKMKSLLMLLIYVAVCFIYPRRDPIIEKMVYVLIPFVVFNTKRIGRFLLISIPIGIVFFISFVELTNQLTFGEESILHSIGSYSFGSFSALSNALDVGYPSNTNLPLGNTFYFVYTILKFISPDLTPPGIVLKTLDDHSVNVYTSLIAPIIDSGNDGYLLILNVFLYAVFIGGIISLIVNLYNKHMNVSSLYLLCSCSSCAIRSFFNPTFSYFEILPAFLISLLMAALLKENFIISFGNKKSNDSRSGIFRSFKPSENLMNKEELCK